jgi:murein DD-endopeptidase MepM/ murein hydrolase activator NlpD
MLVVGEQMLK